MNRLTPLSSRDTRRLSAAFCPTCDGHGFVRGAFNSPLNVELGACPDCARERVTAELTRWQRLRNALLWTFVAVLAAAVMALAYCVLSCT